MSVLSSTVPARAKLLLSERVLGSKVPRERGYFTKKCGLGASFFFFFFFFKKKFKQFSLTCGDGLKELKHV